MFRTIVDHVAALAEGREVRAGVVRRVMIAVGSSQHHPRRADRPEHVVVAYGQADDPPCLSISVPPAPIAEMIDRPAMQSLAALTPPPALRKRITAESWGRWSGYMAEKCVVVRMR